MTTLTRRVRRAVVVLVAVAGLTLAVAAPAQAQWIVARDGFEGSGTSGWQFTRSGTGNGGIERDSAYAFEGRNNGWLSVQTGFSSVGRPVTLRSGVSIRCNAWIYVQTPGATLNIEIINPSTWTYVVVKTVTIGNTGTGYTLADVGPWLVGNINVQFRVSLLAGSAPSWVRLDAFGAQCWLG